MAIIKTYGKQYDNENVVVSLTSFGKRFDSAAKSIYSILEGTFKSVHVVLTIYLSDETYLTPALKLFIDNELIELLVVDKNLRSHLKYFYAMQKYKTVPIITIDDDMIYYPNTVEDLYSEVVKSKCIISRKCRKMTFNKGKINPFNKWIWDSREEEPSRKLHALGFSGVIYPAGVFKLDEGSENEILKSCLRADDIYLNVLEIRAGVKVKCLHKNYGRFTNLIESKGFKSLSKDSDNLKVTNQYIQNFKKEFNSCST